VVHEPLGQPARAHRVAVQIGRHAVRWLDRTLSGHPALKWTERELVEALATLETARRNR